MSVIRQQAENCRLMAFFVFGENAAFPERNQHSSNTPAGYRVLRGLPGCFSAEEECSRSFILWNDVSGATAIIVHGSDFWSCSGQALPISGKWTDLFGETTIIYLKVANRSAIIMVGIYVEHCGGRHRKKGGRLRNADFVTIACDRK